MPKIDLPNTATPEPAFVLVTIPKEDLIGMEHPPVIVTGKKYLPGNTYKLSPADGAWIEKRLKMFHESQVKLNRSAQDGKSMRESAMYGSAKSGSFVNPHAPEFS
jgi:hypothetical protein